MFIRQRQVCVFVRAYLGAHNHHGYSQVVCECAIAQR